MADSNQWNAQKYVAVSGQQMKWALGALAEAGLSGTENLLDIGCGDGKITARIADSTTGMVVGVDHSSDMIAFATRLHGNQAGKNLRFEVGEAETFRPTIELDVIVSFTALHWVSDHERLLSHFAALLRPGGRIVLQFPGEGNAEELTDIVLQTMHSPRWRHYFRAFVFPWCLFSVEEYEKRLRVSGFKPISVSMEPRTMTHEGPEGLAAWLTATWLPFTAPIPIEYRKEFLQSITSAYSRFFPPDNAGMLRTKMCRLQIIATRGAPNH